MALFRQQLFILLVSFFISLVIFWVCSLVTRATNRNGALVPHVVPFIILILLFFLAIFTVAGILIFALYLVLFEVPNMAGYLKFVLPLFSVAVGYIVAVFVRNRLELFW